MSSEQVNDGRRDAQPQTQKQTAFDKVVTSLTSRSGEPSSSGGIPFGWGLLFAIVLLAAIFIGHYLTVQGQNTYIQRERERGQANSSSPLQNQQDLTDVLKKLMEQNNSKKPEQHSSINTSGSAASVNKISETMISVSQNMSGIAEKIATDGRTFDQNLKLVRDNLEALTQTLKDDTSKRDILAKLEQALTVKTATETASGKAIDLQSLNTLSARFDQVAAKNDIEAVRRDLSGLSSKVQDLSALIRSKETVPGLGEEFRPKK